eukprot:COSAG01_NODE_2029_length_8590_cov_5.719501_13_plen_108_part_00
MLSEGAGPAQTRARQTSAGNTSTTTTTTTTPTYITYNAARAPDQCPAFCHLGVAPRAVALPLRAHGAVHEPEQEQPQQQRLHHARRALWPPRPVRLSISGQGGTSRR